MDRPHEIWKELATPAPYVVAETVANRDSCDQLQLAMGHEVSDEQGNKFSSDRQFFKITEAAGPVDRDSSILNQAAYFVYFMAKIARGTE